MPDVDPALPRPSPAVIDLARDARGLRLARWIARVTIAVAFTHYMICLILSYDNNPWTTYASPAFAILIISCAMAMLLKYGSTTQAALLVGLVHLHTLVIRTWYELKHMEQPTRSIVQSLVDHVSRPLAMLDPWKGPYDPIRVIDVVLLLYALSPLYLLYLTWTANRLPRAQLGLRSIARNRIRLAVSGVKGALPKHRMIALLMVLCAVAWLAGSIMILNSDAALKLSHAAERLGDPYTTAYFIANITVLLLGVGLPPLLMSRSALRRIRAAADVAVTAYQAEPILLLRSFKDDLAAVRPKGLAAILQFRRIRLEEAIAGAARQHGPLIAIGAPGENLPQLGAYRAYFAEQEWQSAVLKWMADSQSIIMVAGLTPWVLWELGQIREQDLVAKTIIMLPPAGEAGIRERWDHFSSCFAGSGWALALSQVDPRRVLGAYFQRDGGIVLLLGRKRDEIEYHLAMRAALATSRAAA